MIRLFAAFFAALFIAGCEKGPALQPLAATQEPSSSAKNPDNDSFPKLLTTGHLPNAVKIHEKVISGGLPEGDQAFQELVDLGVKTIISVDGAKPDVETARKFGLRYVHLPHAYNGISDERAQQLAKAVRELDGPIYIHCHHGKHRSPAAASVACVTAGMLAPARGIAVLEMAGTSPGYLGLFQSVKNAHPVPTESLDQLQFEFQETVAVPPMADAMVLLEHTHDHLRKIEENGWQTPDNHPDLDPAHLSLMLQEHFTELLRTDEVRQQPEHFRAILRSSEQASLELHSGLLEWARQSNRTTPPTEFKKLSERIAADCKSCHQKYRDTALQKK